MQVITPLSFKPGPEAQILTVAPGLKVPRAQGPLPKQPIQVYACKFLLK